jgi:hypothetical protein
VDLAERRGLNQPKPVLRKKEEFCLSRRSETSQEKDVRQSGRKIRQVNDRTTPSRNPNSIPVTGAKGAAAEMVPRRNCSHPMLTRVLRALSSREFRTESNVAFEEFTA